MWAAGAGSAWPPARPSCQPCSLAGGGSNSADAAQEAEPRAGASSVLTALQQESRLRDGQELTVNQSFSVISGLMPVR